MVFYQKLAHVYTIKLCIQTIYANRWSQTKLENISIRRFGSYVHVLQKLRTSICFRPFIEWCVANCTSIDGSYVWQESAHMLQAHRCPLSDCAKHLPCLTRNSATSRFRKCAINFDIVMYLQTYFVHVNWKRHELFQIMIGTCRFNLAKIIIWYNICITISYLFFHKYVMHNNGTTSWYSLIN